MLVGLAENDPEIKARLAGLRQGLEKLGWSEDLNVRIDYRFAPAGAQADTFARELIAVATRCDRRAVNTRHRRGAGT